MHLPIQHIFSRYIFFCSIFRCRCLFTLDTHLDLHKEVPQVLLEGGDVLIQAEQTCYKHLHLGTEEKTLS